MSAAGSWTTCDVDLRAGEVLGVAGLPGSGRNELPYALVGSMPGATGQIQLAGGEWVPLKKSASFDIPIVPADRAREAVISEFSVGENISLSVLSRLANFGWMRAQGRAPVGRRMDEHHRSQGVVA